MHASNYKQAHWQENEQTNTSIILDRAISERHIKLRAVGSRRGLRNARGLWCAIAARGSSVTGATGLVLCFDGRPGPEC
jgi:hypothetical protein